MAELLLNGQSVLKTDAHVLVATIEEVIDDYLREGKTLRLAISIGGDTPICTTHIISRGVLVQCLYPGQTSPPETSEDDMARIMSTISDDGFLFLDAASVTIRN